MTDQTSPVPSVRNRVRVRVTGTRLVGAVQPVASALGQEERAGPFVVSRRLALKLWLILSLVFSVGTAAYQLSTENVSDRVFGLFYRSVSTWLQGGDPYHVILTVSGRLDLPNLNPPIWFLVFAPVAWLPIDVAALVWAGLTLAALAASLVLSDQIGDSRPWRSWRGLALLAAPTIWDTLVRGQVYPFVLLPLAAGWFFACRGRWSSSAVLLGLAISLKPPLFLIVVALFWADRRFSLKTAAASAAWSLAPVLVVPPVDFPRWLAVTREAPIQLWLNSSWTALATRWLGSLAGDGVLVAVIGLTVLIGLRTCDREAAIAVGVCASLLASPITWPSYFVLLIPGFFWLSKRARLSRWLDLGLIVGACPFVIQTLVTFLPIYATALTIFSWEMARAATTVVPAEPGGTRN